MLDMQSHAPYKEAFGERFQQNDEYVRHMPRTAIDHGIMEGVFSDIDAVHAAQALTTIVDGARPRTVILDDAETLETAAGPPTRT